MNTQLIYCSKGKAQVSNEEDGTFFNQIGSGIVVDEGDEISVEQVCINATGIGADVIEVPNRIQGYEYSSSSMVLNCWYYINQNYRYMNCCPPNNMTQATDIVTTITAEDYGTISDTYTFPALPIQNLQNNSGMNNKVMGKRFYVGAWFSNPQDIREGNMYPPKAVGGVRVYPTQEGHNWSCLEGNLRFDVDKGYDSPSNIAEKITTDFHSANASVQDIYSDIGLITARFAQLTQADARPLGVFDEDTCSVTINAMHGLYTDPTGSNFYSGLFGTNNPMYLFYGSRLLSKYTIDGGSGAKANTYLSTIATSPPHDNEIYILLDLPILTPPAPQPTEVTIPAGYLLCSNLLWNESTIEILEKFMKTQKILENAATLPLTTNDLESLAVRSNYFLPIQFGKFKSNQVSPPTICLQSPVTDPATQPAAHDDTFNASVFFDAPSYDEYVLPDTFEANGFSVDDAFIITYKGVQYTARDLARKLNLQIKCINTGTSGNNERAIALMANSSRSVFNKRFYAGEYFLVDIGLHNRRVTQANIINPALINGGTNTNIDDYAKQMQIGAPNMNMVFDSVRSRFGISNMSFPRILDNAGLSTANASAGQLAITSNYNGFPQPEYQNATQPAIPYTFYSQSGLGIHTLSVVTEDGEVLKIDQFDDDDIKQKYTNSILDRMGFTFRQLANWYGGDPSFYFIQKNYETTKPVVYANAFPYPLTNNLRFDTALNQSLSVNNNNLPMFDLQAQRGFFNINIQSTSDTCFAVNLPIKLVTPFYLVKSDIFEGDVAFNSENNGATESIMICTNKAYTSGDYAYSFGTQYTFKATKSFVISGIKTAILKPDLSPAEIDNGTAVIYKVVKPVKFFQDLQQEQMKIAGEKNKKEPKS